jgi:hypothetical protein
VAVSSTSFALGGGLNVADEQITLRPGDLTDCLNIDVTIAGGYARTGGYEAFDGSSPKPSNSDYAMLGFQTGGVRAVQFEDEIVGGISGATATICDAASLTTGDWGASTAQGVVGIALIDGFFQVGEPVTIGGIYAFSVTSLPADSTLDDPNRKGYRRGAANAARALIQPPDGSGAIRGVFTLKGETYAVRDNATATAGVIHKATPTGWVAQTFASLLEFDTGSALLLDGMAINGQTSGATATIRRVAFRGGSWAGSTAKGVLALTNVVGTFENDENIRVGTTVHAKVDGIVYVPSLSAGGVYEFVQWNFYASFDTQRIYGVNAVDKGFEFEDGMLIPISTGMPTDAPEHVAVHKNYLYFSFKGSLQNSGVGEPHAWTARLGATEIGIGEQISAIYSIRNDVLGVASVNAISLLYGSSQLDWQLKKMSDKMGAYPRCMIDVPGSTVVLDTNGMQSVNGSQAFGDFEGASLSRKVNPLLRELGAPVAMIANRIKSQIRTYYASGAVVVATYVGDRISGWTKWAYPIGISCVWTGEDANGKEATFIGAVDGNVYETDRGNSFNGELIQSLIRLPFHHYGAPERKKRWRKLTVEMRARDALPIQFATEYDYSDGQYLSFAPPMSPTNGGYYDAGFEYGDFAYDGGVFAKVTGHIDGISTNMSIMVYVEDDVAESWIAQAVHLQLSPYGLER